MGLLDRVLRPSLEQWTELATAELADWEARARTLTGYWEWFDGARLLERDESAPADRNGDRPLKYPLQINPIATAARVHSFALWGEVQDTSDPLVRLVIEPADEAGRFLAREAEQALSQVLYENNARAVLLECGLLSQSLAGVVFKLGWDGAEAPERPARLRLEHYDPRHFHARWTGRDYWNLSHAWIKMDISLAEAQALGAKAARSARTAVYVEHWNRAQYWVRIDGHQIEGGPNPWGFVPFVYIPHERIGGMWGRSLVPETVGLVKELNSRMADMGDAVHLGVNSLILMWNLKNGYPVEQTLPNGQPFINLGRAISQGDPQPGGERLAAPNLPAGSDKFNASLLDQARTYLLTPAISYGEEEGTQRSGQTLFQRMWPLLSHVRQERTLWTTGLVLLAEMILRMLARKRHLEITAAHLGLRKRVIWAEMVPVDRAALTDEMIQRKQVGLASTRHALTRFGDVEDLDAEERRIAADQETKAALEAKVRQPVAAG